MHQTSNPFPGHRPQVADETGGSGPPHPTVTSTTTSPGSTAALARRPHCGIYTNIHTAPYRRPERSHTKCPVQQLANCGQSVMTITSCGSQTGFDKSPSLHSDGLIHPNTLKARLRCVTMGGEGSILLTHRKLLCSYMLSSCSSHNLSKGCHLRIPFSFPPEIYLDNVM